VVSLASNTILLSKVHKRTIINDIKLKNIVVIYKRLRGLCVTVTISAYHACLFFSDGEAVAAFDSLQLVRPLCLWVSVDWITLTILFCILSNCM
jgi:hypothetical protein